MMNGVEATQKMKALGLPQLPPIVAMTAFSMTEERDDFLKAGMDDFIAKPINAQALINKVKKWVKSPASEGEAAPPAAPPSKLLILNNQTVEQLRKFGGDEMVLESYQEFLEEAALQLGDCQQAWSDRDFGSLRSVLHTLKGNAGTLGAEQLAEAARLAEVSAKTHDAEALPGQLAGMQAAFAAFKGHCGTTMGLKTGD
jgi:hypothetical protein